MGAYFNLMLLAAIFGVSLVIFLRPSVRFLGLLAGVVAVGCLLMVGLMSGVLRGQGSLVSAVSLLSMGLVLLFDRRNAGSYAMRERRAAPRKTPQAPKAAKPARASQGAVTSFQLPSLPSLPKLSDKLSHKLAQKGQTKSQSKTKSTKMSKSRTTGAGVAAGSGGAVNLDLQDYEVLDRIGVGGMGSVYRARRRQDGRTVALKVPQEKYLADAKFVKRFYREAEVLKRFDHPNIVKVYDYRSEGDEYYIAMEYLDGQSLESLLEDRSLAFTEAVDVLRALADALRHIHAQNVVHRDIKPGNVMILRGALEGGHLKAGGIRLMDFGIAVGKVLTRLTMTGARVGTPIYMAPEQAKGHRVDTRSDVYSLGLLAYEMVTGTTAFRGSYDAVVHQQIFETPKPPKQVCLEVPGKLNDLVLAMIEKDPALRPTLDEVIARIDAGVLDDEAFTDPVALLMSVHEKRGTLRLLDLHGKLRQSVRDTGAGGLSTAPSALTTDPAGYLYFSIPEARPTKGMPLIHKLDREGQEVLSFGPYGMSEQELIQPVSLAVAAGYLYVLDGETHYITAYSLKGEYQFRFGGRGSGQGRFNRPRLLVTTPQQQLLVLDMGNREIQRFDVRGHYLSRYAFRMDKTSEELRPLTGLGVDAQGTVYIVDGVANKVRKVDANDVPSNTFSLETLIGESADAPWLIQVGKDHQVFVVRQGGHTLRLYSAVGDLLSSHDMYAPVQAIQLVKR